MPHLQFRNKYWWIGSDDLAIPAAYSITGRFFWEFFLIIVTYLDFHGLTSCSNGLVLLVYLISTIAVQFLMIVNDFIILCVSLRGTIIDITHERQSLSYFLYFRLLLTYMEGFVFVIGCIGWILSIEHLPCSAGSERTKINLIIFGVLLLSQVLDLTSIIGCSYLLPKNVDTHRMNYHNDRTLSQSQAQANAIGILDDEESILARWEDRINRAIKAIQFYGCNRYGGDNVNESLRNVARVFTRMFHHEGFLDVVPSDVVAGMIIVRLEQFTHRNEAIAMIREQNQMKQNDPLFFWQHEQNVLRRSRKLQFKRSREKTLAKPSKQGSSTSRSGRSRSRSSSNPMITESLLSLSPISSMSSDQMQDRIHDSDSGNLGDEESIDKEEYDQEEMKEYDATVPHTKHDDDTHRLKHKKVALLPSGVLRDVDDISVTSSSPISGRRPYGRSHRHEEEDLSESSSNSIGNSIDHKDEERSGNDEGTGSVTAERLEQIARYSIYAAAIYTRIVPFNSVGIKMAHYLTNCVTCQYNRPPGVEMCWCCWFGQKISKGSSSSSQLELFSRSKAMNITVNATSSTAHYHDASSDRDRITPKPLEGIDFCGYNRAGLSVFTEIIDQNHHIRAVVITIRGTLSIEDGITDIACEPKEMREAGNRWGFDGRNRFAHGGMLRAAEVMCEEIVEAKILEKIFGRKSYTDQEQAPPFANYQLVITGHSLGAGAAILLGWILRTRYPNVRCVGFGTPASVLDRQSCLDTKQYVTTVILGNDIISRLSIRSVMSLHNQVLYAIARAKAHKLYILSALLRPIDIEKAVYPPGTEPDSEFKQAYLAYKDFMAARLDRPDNVELLIPGSILHFVKTKIDMGWWSDSAVYSIVHGKMEDYEQIPISATMRSDHHPDQYYHELHRVLRHFKHK